MTLAWIRTCLSLHLFILCLGRYFVDEKTMFSPYYRRINGASTNVIKGCFRYLEISWVNALRSSLRNPHRTSRHIYHSRLQGPHVRGRSMTRTFEAN